MEEPEHLARAFFEAWAARDANRLAGMYTADAEYVRADGTSRGVDEIIAYCKEIWESFPDETATIKAVLVSPLGVTVEWTESATHTRPRKTPLGVIPPTGQGFKDAPVAEIFRFRDGKIASQHEYYDLFSMMRQLGWLGLFAKAMPKA
ncbi:MAG: nuclear transport factor 2 family protein [Candidatus Dormibacteraceae bacterium]